MCLPKLVSEVDVAFHKGGHYIYVNVVAIHKFEECLLNTGSFTLTNKILTLGK